MKRKLGLIATCLLSITMLSGCGNNSGNYEEYNDKPYVTFEDGETSFEYEVSEYGVEFALPECPNAGESFYGWLGMDGLYQPGDKLLAEEFMTFIAIRTSPEYGTLVAIDTTRGGYSTMSSEDEEILIYSPYENYPISDYDDFFDYWVDDAGNTYNGGESVNINKGDILILNSVYSTDYSKAYKVDVHYNTGMDFDYDAYCYVKKGESIPLYLFIELNDYNFDGWFDDKEGGNYITNADDYFTPTSDIALYAHWSKK